MILYNLHYNQINMIFKLLLLTCQILILRAQTWKSPSWGGTIKPVFTVETDNELIAPTLESSALTYLNSIFQTVANATSVAFLKKTDSVHIVPVSKLQEQLTNNDILHDKDGEVTTIIPGGRYCFSTANPSAYTWRDLDDATKVWLSGTSSTMARTLVTKRCNDLPLVSACFNENVKKVMESVESSWSPGFTVVKPYRFEKNVLVNTGTTNQPGDWHTCTCKDGSTYECKSNQGDGAACCGRSAPAICGTGNVDMSGDALSNTTSSTNWHTCMCEDGSTYQCKSNRGDGDACCDRSLEAICGPPASTGQGVQLDFQVIHEQIAKLPTSNNDWHTCKCKDGSTYECKSALDDGAACCERSALAICGAGNVEGTASEWHTCTCNDGSTYQCKSNQGDGAACCERSMPAICGDTTSSTTTTSEWHTCTCKDSSTYECKSNQGDGAACCERSMPAICGADNVVSTVASKSDQMLRNAQPVSLVANFGRNTCNRGFRGCIPTDPCLFVNDTCVASTVKQSFVPISEMASSLVSALDVDAYNHAIEQSFNRQPACTDLKSVYAVGQCCGVDGIGEVCGIGTTWDIDSKRCTMSQMDVVQSSPQNMVSFKRIRTNDITLDPQKDFSFFRPDSSNWLTLVTEGDTTCNIRFRHEVTTTKGKIQADKVTQAFLDIYLQQNGATIAQQYVLHSLINDHLLFFSRGLHNNGAFLPWHRGYILTLETLLMEHDHNIVGLPYWNFSTSPRVEPLFETEVPYYGTNGDSRRCVQGGRFGFNSGVQGGFSLLNGRCLQRRFGGGSAASVESMSSQLFDRYPTASDYDRFRNRLEHGPGLHDSIHCLVGGTMCSARAANDPIFFLIHAGVDKIWHMWQQKSTEHKNAYTGTTGIDEILPAATYTPREMLDNNHLLLTLPFNETIQRCIQVLYDPEEGSTATITLAPDNSKRHHHGAKYCGRNTVWDAATNQCVCYE